MQQVQLARRWGEVLHGLRGRTGALECDAVELHHDAAGVVHWRVGYGQGELAGFVAPAAAAARSQAESR